MLTALASVVSLAVGAPNLQGALEEGIRRYWNGEYEETIGVLGAACPIEPSLGDKLECHKYLAFSQIALGDDDAAEQSFAEILSADPLYRLDETLVSPKILTRFEASRQQLATTLYEIGKEAYQSQDFETALARFDDALALSPDNDLAREYRDIVSERMIIAEAQQSAQTANEESTAGQQTTSSAAGQQTTPSTAGQPPTPSTAEPPDDQVYRITSDVVRPELIAQTPPLYPPVARQMRWTGTVVLSAVIDKDGNVVDPAVIRPLRDVLDAAAIQAVQRWRYRPATRNGYPVAVHWIIQINFQL